MYVKNWWFFWWVRRNPYKTVLYWNKCWLLIVEPIVHWFCRKTVAMRDKERLHDYRFMPEPNLPPLRLYTRREETSETNHKDISYNDEVSLFDEEDQRVYIDDVRQQIPMLPEDQRRHLIQHYELRTDYAVIIVVSSCTCTALFSLLEWLVHIGLLLCTWCCRRISPCSCVCLL